MSEPVNTLETWLGIATDKLTQAGKERITFEITSHFDDAVASYRANGLTEADAQARALADLGNARKAARRFRKRHLTESEADFLERRLSIYRKSRKPWTQLGFWMFLGYLSFALRREHAFALSLAAIGGVLFFVESFLFPLASRRGFRLLRLILALDTLSWLGLFIYIGCVSGWLFAGMVFPVMSWKWFPPFHLWFKLGKLADQGRETRPPGAIAS